MSEYFYICGWSNICWNCFHIQDPTKNTCDMCNSKLIEIYHYFCNNCIHKKNLKCISKLELKQCILCNYEQLKTNSECSNCTYLMS